MKLLILFIAFFLSNPPQDFDFPTLLKKNREILRLSHHVGQTDLLKKFDQFSRFDPKASKYYVFYVNKCRIEKWLPENGYIKSVIKIRLAIPMDTVSFNLKGIKLTKKDKDSKFVFTAYRFVTNSNRFTYIANDSEGLIEYDIDSKEFPIFYESIAIDINYSDALRDIKRALNDAKFK